MIFNENRLPADDSHEISCLICYFLLFLKKQQNLKLPSAANYRWRFMGILLTLIWMHVKRLIYRGTEKLQCGVFKQLKQLFSK